MFTLYSVYSRWVLTSEFYFSLYSFCLYLTMFETLFPCSCGAEKFQLPSLCLPFCLFVVLFIEPSCHFGGGPDLQQLFLFQLALDSYIQLGDICLLDRIFTSRFHHVAFIQPFAEKKKCGPFDQFALHSHVSFIRSFFSQMSF